MRTLFEAIAPAPKAPRSLYVTTEDKEQAEGLGLREVPQEIRSWIAIARPQG
ncbi:hypothetical protein ABZS88_38905 [Streptomyces sp. NPDC005480]|uniref:hypothetical protein n=1 Tax=Streptomyces sp. NPDC005480 TaxID=3154880 RepID=UPI0033B8251C